jgi:hypothetical protein
MTILSSMDFSSGSPEGERATEVLDTLLDLMEDVQVDPKQRRFVWPDAGQLTLQQSLEHIQKQCPDFSVEEIEGHLLYWIESTARTTVPSGNWKSVQVGTEGWCRSNKRMGPKKKESQNQAKSPTRFHGEARK